MSSDAADDAHRIAPLSVVADPNAAWQALSAYVQAQPRFTVLETGDDYLRIEARTRLMRFVDDVEFHLRPDAGHIAMRSASRVGHSDFGANRKRMEAVRTALAGNGVVAPAD